MAFLLAGNPDVVDSNPGQKVFELYIKKIIHTFHLREIQKIENYKISQRFFFQTIMLF